MEVKIDGKNKIRITPEYYAAMKLSQRKEGAEWIEYKWFDSLEECIRFLTQRRLAQREGCFNLEKFLMEYKKTMQAVESIFKINEVVSDVNF
jgi:hypothetical protein